MDGIFEMTCRTCDTVFNFLTSNCGTGASWDLFKCAQCGQLYAEKNKPGGFFPEEILNDKRIILI